MQPVPASAHLYSSQTGGSGEAETRVIRTRAQWEGAWAELQRGLAAGPAPAVDFSREMVVLVAIGQRPTGGHTVRVDGTEATTGGALVVHLTRTSPGPGCMTTQAESSPIDVVRVPRATGEVRFVSREVSTPC